MTQFYNREGSTVCVTFVSELLKRKFFSLYPVLQSFFYFKIQDSGGLDGSFGPVLASAGTTVVVVAKAKALGLVDQKNDGDSMVGYKAVVEIIEIEFANLDD
jgi:hypothetical protein